MRSRHWSPPRPMVAGSSPTTTSSNCTASSGGLQNNCHHGTAVPMTELLVKEAVPPNSSAVATDRCVYYTPPAAGLGNGGQRTPGAQQQKAVGLRRFLFFGDSPQPMRRPPPTFNSSNRPLDDEDALCSPPLGAIRAGRSMLGRKAMGLTRSHSSRTISLDFDSESTGTTVPVEEISPPHYTKRHKCNGSANGGHQTATPKQQQSNGGIRHSQYHQHQQNNHMDASPPSANSGGGQRRRPAPAPQQLHHHYGGGSQFDTQSLQARRSRSFAAQHPQQYSNGNGLYATTTNGGNAVSEQPAGPPVVRYGSCSNLSVTGANGQQLVLYEGGGGGGGHLQQMTEAAAAHHRHSMLLPMDMPQQMPTPIWYQPMMPPPLPPPPPPPPFYYTAGTLPHPVAAPPMDYAGFKRVMKESKRLEKKQRKMMLAEFGDDSFGGTCCEFCCGGSALVLWLVVSLVALGFLGFLLLAIYFV